MAVNPTAISSGKKIAKTGSKMVPKPKPDIKVIPEAMNATRQMIITSGITGIF